MTPLNSAIGYEEAAKVAKEALKERKTIRQTVIDRGLIGDKLSEEELDKRLDVLAMAKVKDGRLLPARASGRNAVTIRSAPGRCHGPDDHLPVPGRHR